MPLGVFGRHRSCYTDPQFPPAGVSSPSPAPRVVVLTTYYHPVVGGAETHARQFARGLVNRGVPAWVLTKLIDASTPRSEVLDGVPVQRIGPRGRRTGSAKWRLIPHAARALVRARDRYDVVVSVDFRGVGLAALAARWRTGKPVILQAATPGALSCANWDPSLARLRLKPQGMIGRAIKRPMCALYGGADAYACISQEIVREALERRIEPSRVAYLPHMIDTRRWRPPTAAERADTRRALGLSADRPVVAFVGRLSVEKGVLDLVEAWRQLDRADATLLLVGPGMPGHPLDAAPAVRAAVAALPAGRVMLYGAVADVRPILVAADVFVQPSHYEAFGISVLEAMSCERAVVASAVGGMAEYLRDGVNALLAPPRDQNSLAERIRAVLEHPALRARLGSAARQTVEGEFDEDVVMERWLTVLRATAGTRGAEGAGTVASSGAVL